MCVLYGPRHMERGVTPDVVLRGVTKAFGDLVAVAAGAHGVDPGGVLARLGPWGGGTTCDGPIGPDGTFQRCVTAGAMGFGGTNCSIVNINDLGNQVPYVGP